MPHHVIINMEDILAVVVLTVVVLFRRNTSLFLCIHFFFWTRLGREEVTLSKYVLLYKPQTFNDTSRIIFASFPLVCFRSNYDTKSWWLYFGGHTVCKYVTSIAGKLSPINKSQENKVDVSSFSEDK